MDDSVSLRITCNVVPDTDCTYSESGLCWVKGQLNVSASAQSTPYTAVLRLTNGLKPREREVPPLSETNGIQIRQMEITIKDPAGNKPNLGSLPNPYTVPASGFIEPGSDGLVGADLVPSAYVERLRALSGSMKTVSLSVFARGRTSGDVAVESGTWPWYISLITDTLDPGAQGSRCIQIEDPVCSFAQDGYANVCDPALVTGDN
ncbi:MAG TPA: hypothetical protein VFZ61_25370 [Polyangiales bacterium]